MHIFDILAACVGLVLVVIGVKRGLIGEATRLIAVIAGFAAAMAGYRAFTPWLELLPLAAATRTALAFLSVFLAATAAALALGWVVRRIVHLTVLGWVDRLCGGLIGLAKAVLLATLVVTVLSALPLRRLHRRLEDSRLYSFLSGLPPSLAPPFRGNKPGLHENIIESQPVKKLLETGNRIEQFRQKVDSAKAAYDSGTAGVSERNRGN